MIELGTTAWQIPLGIKCLLSNGSIHMLIGQSAAFIYIIVINLWMGLEDESKVRLYYNNKWKNDSCLLSKYFMAKMLTAFLTVTYFL